jgi:hypothetical protein
MMQGDEDIEMSQPADYVFYVFAGNDVMHERPHCLRF